MTRTRSTRRALSLLQAFLLLAVGMMVVILGLTALSAWRYHQDTLEQQLSTTRAMVAQAQGIVKKYQAQVSAGSLPQAEAQAHALAEIKALRYNTSEYLWVQDDQARMLMHPIKPELDGKDMSQTKDPNGKLLFVAFSKQVKESGSGYVDYLWPKVGSTEPVPKRSFVAGVDQWPWIIGSGVYVDEVRAQAARFAALSGVVGLVACGLALAFALWMSRHVRGRLALAEQALQAIATGDLSRPVPEGGDDEIGRLLRATAQARDGLEGLVLQVRTAAEGLGTASTEIATGNQDLSLRTEQTASNLQQAASSVEQLTGNVRQSADSAALANNLASEAAQVAGRSGEMVDRVISTMDEISASSRRIGDIIGVIDGIAFQTNILALNAAVEAARAGEQGRGFAVVAGEVRTLASRSAEAAREIKQLIAASVERVESGSRLVTEAGGTIRELVGAVQQVSSVVGEISAAASEQSQGIAQVNEAVNHLDQMTQQNAALVEQSAAAAESLREQTGRLTEMVHSFRVTGA